MARQESDREDLYEELHLVVPRWEFLPDAGETPVVAGIREDGRFLLYMTPDQVFQFDAENRLLRAFDHGDRYRTQGSTLARLRHQRTETTSELLRYDLSPVELERFFQSLRESLQWLIVCLEGGRARFLRSTDQKTDQQSLLQERLSGCLKTMPELAPAYRTRRK
ncbi:MAG TPA: hypothetical protein VNQ76_17655 [Planctomicrobium sp.]|nr:hypothetical protein [Planctomicrobium sp.]